MALVVKDRVKDTTTTTGTGTITLANSPPNGYQAFSSLGDGSTTYYAIEDADKTDWEVGIGTYTLSGHTLARTTVLASTNSNNAISLSSGEHTVFCDYPSGKAFLSDEGIDKTFTASGTVTAGKPMQLKTDGTAEQILKDVTTTNYDPQDATSEHTITGSDHWYTSGVEYNSTAGVLLFSNSNNSTYYPMITPATANADGTLNMGTSTIVESTVTYGGYVTSNTQANEFLYTWSWAGNTQGVRMKAGTIGGTSTAPTVTLGSMVQQDDRYTYYINTCYDSNVDRYCTAFYQSNDNGQTMGEVYAYTTSVSGTTPTLQNANGTRIFTSYNGSGGYSSQMTLCAFDASANRVLVRVNGLTSDGGSTYKVMLQTIEVTTTGISGASNTPVHLDSTLSSSSPHAQSEATGCLKYDPDGERMLVGYALRGASDALTRGKLKLANVSSTSCALGAETTVGSDPCKNLAFGYDENIDKFGIYISSGSFGTTCDFYNMTYDGSDNITLSSKVVVNGSYGYRINNNTGTIMPYVPTVFAMYSAITNSTTTFLYSFQSKQVVTTFNFDADRYLGVASTSATNGNEVQVNMPDKSINVDQTGLTIGEEYFTDNEGAVRPFYSGGASLTTGEYLGTAVSATDLQLKETPTELIGNSAVSITKGDPVVVESDGNFSKVRNVSQTTTYTYSKGTETELVEGNMLNTVQSCYDANANRFVVAYMDGDDSNHGKAIVVSTSGTTPSVTVTGTFIAATNGGEYPIPVYDSTNNKTVIIYSKGSDSSKGASVVATVGASSISFGTEVLYNSSSNGGFGSRQAYFDEANEKIVLFGKDQSNSNYPTVWIGTVSGTSITWGSAVVVESAGITDTLAAQYSSGSEKGLFVWKDSNPYGQAIVGTVSGTSMTFGSKLQFTTENINSSFAGKGNPLCYDSGADKFLFLYQISSGDDGEGIVFTISSTSVTAGSETNLHDNWGNTNTIGKSDFGKIPIIYKDSSEDTYYAEVTITGTTPSLSGAAVLNSGTTYFNGLSLDTTQGDIKLLATYEDSSNDMASTVIVPNGTRTATGPNLTTENYIGIAKSSSSAANKTAIITVDGGVDSNQSELTAGQLYYVQTDGTISTTAGSPSVVAGIGLSATELLVTKS